MARFKALAHDLIPDCVLGKYESEALEKKRREFVKSRLEKTNSQEFFRHMVPLKHASKCPWLRCASA